jgi:hypothetical protein
MLYVVLVPWWAWTALLVAGWMILALGASRGPGLRNRVLVGLLAVMALQAVAASSTAIVTSTDPLNDYACLMGYLGMWVALFVSVAEAGVVGYLATVWPRAASGRRRRFGRWTAVWLGFNALALLAHVRSTALCTV